MLRYAASLCLVLTLRPAGILCCVATRLKLSLAKLNLVYSLKPTISYIIMKQSSYI